MLSVVPASQTPFRPSVISLNPFTNDNILQWSKLKEFADDNFEFDENGRKFSKWLENTVGKGEIVTSNFSFSRSVFKRLVLQTRKNQGLFGKGLTSRTLIAQSVVVLT